jgi:hypothetical protein
MRCSGNASMFWDQGAKSYKVQDSFCKKLIPECAPILANTTMFSQYFKASRMMLNAAQGSLAGDKAPNYRSFPEMSLRVPFDGVELFTKAKLESVLDCGFNPVGCLNNVEKMTAFCENFSFMWLNHAVEGNYIVLRDAMLMQRKF